MITVHTLLNDNIMTFFSRSLKITRVKVQLKYVKYDYNCYSFFLIRINDMVPFNRNVL